MFVALQVPVFALSASSCTLLGHFINRSSQDMSVYTNLQKTWQVSVYCVASLQGFLFLYRVLERPVCVICSADGNVGKKMKGRRVFVQSSGPTRPGGVQPCELPAFGGFEGL